MPFVDNSTYSEELLKKRKKYRKTTAIWGSVIFFLTLAIPFAYVFLFGCYNGYGGNKPVEFMQSWNWLRNIKYFDSAITTPFFNIFDNGFDSFVSEGNIFRLLIFFGTIILAICLTIGFCFLSTLIFKKKYSKKYLWTISKIAESIGMMIEFYDDSNNIDTQEINGILKNAGVLDQTLYENIIVKDKNIGWNGIQLQYELKKKKRNAFLMTMVLDNPKDLSFVQFRNFGQPLITNYEDINLTKYGFADNNLLSRFVCYAKENENIYRFIDEKGAKSIFDIQHFFSSPIVITLAGNNLSIFIDGFLLKVAKPYNKKIDENFLNEEVKTFASLNKLFFNLARSFSKELLEQ